MAAEASKPALQIVGDYDLVEKIAEGGMGTVYKGRHRDNGQIVAVKLVSPHMATNPVFLQRFEKEYNAAKSLDHPNIVQALEFGTSGGRPFLVMEFVEGESLGQKLEREGRMAEAEAVRIITKAAEGLERAHKRGLIHRDIKPDNIMVTPSGEVKIADLGLVKELEGDVNLTRTGRGLGTPHFMAPEQFKNAKNADVRCDIYSLGATLYMMVTGKMPFQALGPLEAWMKKVNNEIDPPKKVYSGVTDRIDWVIRKAMSADPEQRPASCREFMDDLSGKTTRKLPTTKQDSQDLWYLLYKDEEGVKHLVKGSATGIRRSLKEGLLGDASNVRASRSKTSNFEPLRNVPEFRDLVMSAMDTAPRAGDENVPTPKNSADAQAKSAGAVSGKRSGPSLSVAGNKDATYEWVMLAILLAVAAIAGIVVGMFLLK